MRRERRGVTKLTFETIHDTTNVMIDKQAPIERKTVLDVEDQLSIILVKNLVAIS